MRRLILGVMLVMLVGAAYADLQNVQVGGIIEMRGRYIQSSFNSKHATTNSMLEVKGPAYWFPGRALGNKDGVVTDRGWSNRANDWRFYESAISMYVKADFTDYVSAMIDLYSFNNWGDDFRTDYRTGVDARNNGNVNVLQSYIETKETFGLPLQLRIGRQQLSFGKKFLVADKTTPTQRIGFDAVRATYTPTKEITIDAWMAKLVENSPVEQDGDVDFYGVYGTYAMSDAINASAYYMLVRDARALPHDTNYSYPTEALERALDIDQYGTTLLNTVGGRFWGKYEGFDYNIDGAYQFGDADAEGISFRTKNFWGTYGDNHAKWDTWAADVEFGYTFDIKWKPRVFVGGVHFGGEDNREVSFAEWLNPFSRPKASVSFNRLFTDTNYCPVLQDNGDMSNFNQVRVGVNLVPTEKLSVMLRAQQLWADKAFAWPVNWQFGRFRIPIAPGLSFWDEDSSKNLGIQGDTIIRYAYSKDFSIVIYAGHLWGGEGRADGNYIHSNGTGFTGGSVADQATYAFWMAILKF